MKESLERLALLGLFVALAHPSPRHAHQPLQQDPRGSAQPEAVGARQTNSLRLEARPERPAAVPSPANPRELGFGERVAAERAIEEFYWRHRIWPESNPRPKPALDDVMPETILRAKVENTLKQSAALELLWQRPITAVHLQAELDRMARDTRRPKMLLDLYAALNNDPVLIAECLARRNLASRLVRSWYARDRRFHGEIGLRAEGALAASGTLEEMRGRSFDAWWGEQSLSIPAAISQPLGPYSLVLPRSAACGAETWSPTRFVPSGRYGHTAVWTGTEMIVWGGTGSTNLNTGGRYDPLTDAWTPTSVGPGVPSPRRDYTAVWTGQEMIVWGGYGTSYLNTGGRYIPSTDTWIATGTGPGVPAPRLDHTAVWTGTEMIVWGGIGASGELNTGGRYKPSTPDSWTATSTGGNVPSARSLHTAVWAGKEMIIWGGRGPTVYLNSGERYDPLTNTWADTNRLGRVPSARGSHTAIWTGKAMIVWGGYDGSYLSTGASYDPMDNAWTSMTVSPPTPSGRSAHTAVWTGSKMIVWGGINGPTRLDTGAVYDPRADTWAPAGEGSAVLSSRSGHTAVWTGTEMIVWGGLGDFLENSGGRYSVASDTWVATNAGNPTVRGRHSAVWTGSEMIVWGGQIILSTNFSETDTGALYDPAADQWTPTSIDVGTPSPRFNHAAVWTGTEMIVWGGAALSGSGSRFDTGGRYDPATDAWTLTSVGAGVPSARESPRAVWTGSEMIVWGGVVASGSAQTGGRYDPSTDSWTPTAVDSATPSGRSGHTMVWTGERVIVWGGSGFNSGGRYDPAADTWAETSVAQGVPSPRSSHTAVWTGSEMIVWGGTDGSSRLASGGRYDPSVDSWTATGSGPNVPAGRSGHTAVWTGNEMIVWGGTGEGGFRLGSGARYNPAGDFWLPVTLGPAAPPARTLHTAVATGSEMIVWGGSNGTSFLNDGGAYCYDCAPMTWYRDEDGDGYGAIGAGVSSCAEPPGYVASSGDCDDASPVVHPDAVETCDGLDNDCDGSTDEGAIPSGRPVLLLERPAGDTARLVWDPVPAPSTYDIVRGSLGLLRSTAGDFTIATQDCLANDLPATMRDDEDLPGFGQGYWYLVRAENCGGPASYDEDAPSQAGSRDDEIEASGAACP